ncbi:hypothetical protein ACJMK2_032812, partial [Sinanodonta woodiana]
WYKATRNLRRHSTGRFRYGNLSALVRIDTELNGRLLLLDSRLASYTDLNITDWIKNNVVKAGLVLVPATNDALCQSNISEAFTKFQLL